MYNRFLKDNGWLLAIYALLFGTAMWFILNYDKVAVHIYLNQFVGNKLLNIFFYYITYFGDGLVAPFMLVLILVYNVRMGIYATASFLSASLFSQLLKHFFFDEVNRPSFIFNYYNSYPLTYVDGVDRYIHNSFPSGHATQAFSIFMCLAFLTKSNFLKALFFSAALLTAFSRVYLSQHWLTDITAGSFIGLFFSALFYYVFISQNKLANLDTPITALKKK
jgi:membrane-associated phospholipid phosphatase